MARFSAGLAIVAALVAATALWTDLTPRVERDFFFSSRSRTLEQTARIEDLFTRHGQLVVIARASDIGSGAYLSRVARLEEELGAVDGVVGTRSLASGPEELDDALESPLWSRLLVAADRSATHLLLFVEDPWPDAMIPRVEAAVARHEAPDFSLSLAGIPHTVTVMQRQLVRDFSVFSAVAVAGFGIASLVLFRSLRIALGMLASCTAAVAATFLALQAAGASLGLLSANLVTIVFVLTQSHLVFLTSNWRRTATERGAEGAVRRALRETLRPSLASMATTLLGFGTLLFVDAKPLRELGLGGVVGGTAAFAAAYALYPLFLAGPAPRARRERDGAVERWLARRSPVAAAAIAVACALLGVGLARLDTDPSLLAYFDEDGEIHEALAYLDRRVGSTPLELVLRRADGRPVLDGEASYRDLWELQRALEREPTVGRIVSLPVVLAEGERFPLVGSLLSRELMLRILETPFFDRVGESFVTADRQQTLFAIQMTEHAREGPRVGVVARLRQVARRHGFEAPTAGGVFYLQGKLSQVVARSMVESLGALALLFTAVAWWTTGSLRVALAMTGVLALAPVAVFGAMGAARVPVDVVTAPAASIGVGLAADTLLHLAVAARRARGAAPFDWPAWAAGIRSQWRAIVRVSLVVGLGFGLFAFSGFPPTRRFGLAIAAATLLAAPLALALLPVAATALARRRAG